MNLPIQLKKEFPNAISLVDALNISITLKKLDYVNDLLSNYSFNVNDCGTCTNSIPIHNAIAINNLDAIKALKNVPGFNINQPSHIEKNTPAIAAAIRQNSDIINEICFNRKANLCYQNKFGNNILSVLICRGFKAEYFQLIEICPPTAIVQKSLCNISLIDKLHIYHHLDWLDKTMFYLTKAKAELAI